MDVKEGCSGTCIPTQNFWYMSFGLVRMCTKQIMQLFQEIQTINAILLLFDVARQIVV